LEVLKECRDYANKLLEMHATHENDMQQHDTYIS